MTMNIRKIVRLEYGWRFSRGEHSEAEQPGFDDHAWAEVRVPHDWAITGPFDRKNDQRYTRIVWDGGQKAGGRPYGYSSFKLDITGLVISGADNLIAVRVENPPLSSRWYPGAGIYRNVRMLILDPVHIAHWGTYITTPEIIGTTASIGYISRLISNFLLFPEVRINLD